MKFFEGIVKEVLKPLSANGIDYCIIGGLAVVASGVRRGTADFDLAIAESETEEALGVVYNQGFKLASVDDLIKLKKADRKNSLLTIQH